MRTPVLIAVGGTGQMVLAAYLRLAAMANFRPPAFFILDSDTRGPMTARLVQLRGQLQTGARSRDLPKRWTLDPFPNEEAELKTFGALFGHLAGDSRDLFECLFSKEAELTNVRTGMYGRPSVGATCIRYKILSGDDDFQELKETLRGGDKHAILVGSCFGGTGSGGLPMLAAEFNRWSKEEGFRLKVDAFVFLPWFRLVPPDGGLKRSDKALHEHLNQNFEPNAAAGIYYFKDQLKEKVDALVLLGVSDRSQNTRASSESEQSETPHILNLLAAVLIQNTFADSLRPPNGISGYWYERDRGLRPETLTIARGQGDGASMTLLNAVHRVWLRQEWLTTLGTLLKNLPKLPAWIQPVFLELALDRLAGQTHRQEHVIVSLVECLERMQAQAKDAFDWIGRLVDDDLFKIQPETLRVQSDRHSEYRQDPLAVLVRWCDQKRVAARFETGDFSSAERFCEKFAYLFIEHLIELLEL